MQDLTKISGLDLRLDSQKNSLVVGPGIVKPRVVITSLKDVKEILVQKDITSPLELYYEYRDLCKINDRERISKNRLRYSLTIIHPDRLGVEFIKTAGCYASCGKVKLYEVILGEPLYLLQKPSPKDNLIIEDVILLKAKAGEKIVIPPGYGYVIFNLSRKQVVVSCWQSSEPAYDYNSYRDSKGAAYFVFEDELGERFEVNPCYKKVPYMRLAYPARMISRFGLAAGVPIYSLLDNDIRSLDFINNPLRYDYKEVFIFQ